MAREIINDNLADDVVGGSFNWWREDDGTRKCLVTGTGGTYICTADAKDTFAWLKAEHRGEGWTEAMYVDELIRRGDFRPI